MKKRLDVLVSTRKLADSRTKAQALILAGQVRVDGKICDKVGFLVEDEADITIHTKYPYVSRGAFKLAGAYQAFSLDFKDQVIVDIGSSTGGFTDFALKNGAKRIYAVDVGKGQLDFSLRNDQRVIVMEKTDFRQIQSFPEKIDYFLCDVSFIGLGQILTKIREIDPVPYGVIALIKPQFEVGQKEASKGKGVIRDPKIREEAVESILAIAKKLDFNIKGRIQSPISGAKGNIEYLIYLERI